MLNIADGDSPEDLLIGADPELLIFDKYGDLIPANTVLVENTSGKVGTDGNESTAELRPYPGKPREVIVELNRLMCDLSNQVSISHHTFTLAGGSGVPGNYTGGHIHFNVPLSIELGKALNYYVALPVIMLVDKRRALRRMHYSDYGRLDCDTLRTQAHGVEYRPLASWLVAKRIGRGVLSAAYMTVHALISGQLPPPQKICFKAYHDVDKDKLLPAARRAMAGWRQMPLYPQFYRPLGVISNLVKTGRTWREDWDAQRRWPQRASKNSRLFVGNSDDCWCMQIAWGLNECPPDWEPPNTPIFIYGLHKDRDEQVVTNFPVKRLPVGYKRRTYGAGKKYQYAIGLAHSIRQFPSSAATLVRWMLSPPMEDET